MRLAVRKNTPHKILQDVVATSSNAEAISIPMTKGFAKSQFSSANSQARRLRMPEVPGTTHAVFSSSGAGVNKNVI